MYEIIDDKGILYKSSSYDEICKRWRELMYDGNPRNVYIVGNLKLIEVLEVSEAPKIKNYLK